METLIPTQEQIKPLSEYRYTEIIDSIYNKGNGIANIIKRTERNKGTYSFNIIPPHGLEIQLKFNIK